MKKTVTTKKSNGFTLIEVLVAIVILALCIGGLSQLFVNVRQLSQMSRSHYIAVNIAKNRIERAKTLKYSDLYLLQEKDGIVNSSGVPDPDGEFKVNTQISQVNSNLKEVVVSVEIKNRLTLEYDGEKEEARTYFADIVIGNNE